MPTYINRTNDIIAGYDYSFPPHVEITTKYFLNLDLFPGLKKISNDPPIPRDFELVLVNQSAAGNMSDLRSFYQSLLIKVEDGSSAPSNGSTADIYVFGSYTDDVNDCNLLTLPIRFTKFQPKDPDGSTLNKWAPTIASGFHDSNLILNIQRDRYMFCTVAVKAVSNGSVNVYVKDIV